MALLPQRVTRGKLSVRGAAHASPAVPAVPPTPPVGAKIWGWAERAGEAGGVANGFENWRMGAALGLLVSSRVRFEFGEALRPLPEGATAPRGGWFEFKDSEMGAAAVEE